MLFRTEVRKTGFHLWRSDTHPSDVMQLLGKRSTPTTTPPGIQANLNRPKLIALAWWPATAPLCR